MGRDRTSNEELVSDLGVGLSQGCPVTQFLYLDPLFSAQSLLPTPNSRKEPSHPPPWSSQLRLNYVNHGEVDHFI